ncbi:MULTISPECIES: F-box-like domain-containing protein [Parachlamydia]
MVLNIFSCLNGRQLSSCMLVNKNWKVLAAVNCECKQENERSL